MDEELVTTESKGPPLPRWAYPIVNPMMKAVLHSPLHGLLSGALMTLRFTGQKSGRTYTIPVGYMEADRKLYLFSHAGWANNFIAGAPVTVRLRGQQRQGVARIVEDPTVIRHFLRRMIAERGEPMAERMGFIERANDGSTRLGRPAGTRFVEITIA